MQIPGAIRRFLIIPCTDGGIAYGFDDDEPLHPQLQVESFAGISESYVGMFVAKNTIQRDMHDILGWMEASPPDWAVPDRSSRRDRHRPDFVAYIIQHSARHGLWWHPSFRGHDHTASLSVYGFRNEGRFPDPEKLAHAHWGDRHWRSQQFQRHFGSLDAAEKLARDFEARLHSATREEDLQVFLGDHPEIITPDYIKCFPKFSLAGEHVTDFVILSGDGYEFIEIERPDKKVFTEGNQLTHFVTQAENQILDWKIVLEKDRSFFERRLPDLFCPRFRLIYGRDKELTQEHKHKLATRFTDVRFHTYDDIYERFCRTIRNLAKPPPPLY